MDKLICWDMNPLQYYNFFPVRIDADIFAQNIFSGYIIPFLTCKFKQRLLGSFAPWKIFVKGSTIHLHSVCISRWTHVLRHCKP